MMNLTGLKLQCDYDPGPKITEQKIIDNKCNVQIDGWKICSLHTYTFLHTFFCFYILSSVYDLIVFDQFFVCWEVSSSNCKVLWIKILTKEIVNKTLYM